jgi:hypothetical protein
MSEALPFACIDCQKRLSVDPNTLGQPAVQKHLARCAVCSRLAVHYREIDKLLNQIPDRQPLLDLRLHFQQVPQAQHISELNEQFVSWEDMLEETSSLHFQPSWLDEPAANFFIQAKKSMKKHASAPDLELSKSLSSGQFEQPLKHPRRSLKRELAATAAVIVVLVNIFAWGLLPRLTHQNTLGGHGPTKPITPLTPASSTSSPTPELTQQYSFTAQDSGKTVTYTVTSRFQIIFDQQKFPQKDVQVSCTLAGTIGSVSNLPSVSPPLYAIRYEGVQPGTCTIRNGNFLLRVIIVR